LDRQAAASFTGQFDQKNAGLFADVFAELMRMNLGFTDKAEVSMIQASEERGAASPNNQARSQILAERRVVGASGLRSKPPPCCRRAPPRYECCRSDGYDSE